MTFLHFIADNPVLACTSLCSIASAIAALTPTPKDDGIARKLSRLVDLLAFNIGHAKEK